MTRNERSLSTPRPPYGGVDSRMMRSTLVVPGHTPHNKLPHQSDSWLQADFTNCAPNENNDGWFEISLTETVTPIRNGDPGRTYCRTISVTLTAEEKARLIALLMADQ